MRAFKHSLQLVATAISLLSVGTNARSQEPNAIQRVSSLDHTTINTPSHHIDHLSHFDVTFSLRDKNQRIKLELEPNHDILAEDAFVQYLDAEGNVHREEAIPRHEHKVYKGRTLKGRGKGMWDPVGSARIYIKSDGPQPLFEGVFSVHGDSHHVELKSTYLEKKRPQDVDIPDRKGDYMVFYRDSDMIRSAHTELKRSVSLSSSCEADKLSFNANPNHPIFLPDEDEDYMPNWGAMSLNSLFGLNKRQSDIGGSSGNAGGVNLRSTIGVTSGCPKTKQVALIGVATDCEFTGSFKDEDAAKQWVINTVNSASSVYEKSFNISIGLRNLTLTDKKCPDNPPASSEWNMPCSKGNITSRLDLFSNWRGQQKDSNAYWTLMSNCPTGPEVGLAWLGQLCNTEVSGDHVSGTNVVVRSPGGGWQIFAHESGHTFGAVHDCTDQTCAQNLEASSQCCPFSTDQCDAKSQFIMNPSTGQDITKFSRCTIGNICSALGRNSVKSHCLSDNRGVTTYTGGQCGNGIVESGEDCDCGGEESCGNNSCCDAKTCKFKNGAVCDDANDSCCSSCKFASADTVCRPSRGECDLEEKCTGNSSTCPSDSYKDDGSKCGNSTAGLTCASGQCTSRDYQCRTVMGSLLHDNSTYACSQFNDQCELICFSKEYAKEFGSQCMSVNQNFLDGTPCGSGGHCSNGKCEGSSIKNWIDKHKNIVIGVACGVGGLIVLAILGCLINRCRRSRPKHIPPPARYGGWTGPMPPASRPSMGQWGTAPAQGYQGLAAGTPPLPPPPYAPAYSNNPPGPGGYMPSPVRYA
ncbi:hypothetical protein EYZ11_004236 [Aspergillus tanneri]|uniref:Disintegrin and metalloproteinase domain-containing protein B n=1 Tax=Aspergillus tanneri TaxID=1220188 RepID=A0A4S3JL40_9EURO|nr:uncharacterized protein ATNIH1004_004613 [Aspergillus tanneri]KAA8648728.1 hypothetical protein ATNIH1004_004613 [Aspergillus tanneri]THC96286.1 hypothetical protein EYZ11_004236 [Aspergillus tanneri]